MFSGHVATRGRSHILRIICRGVALCTLCRCAPDTETAALVFSGVVHQLQHGHARPAGRPGLCRGLPGPALVRRGGQRASTALRLKGGMVASTSANVLDDVEVTSQRAIEESMAPAAAAAADYDSDVMELPAAVRGNGGRASLHGSPIPGR